MPHHSGHTGSTQLGQALEEGERKAQDRAFTGVSQERMSKKVLVH